MARIEEMVKWNYKKAWQFFTNNAVGRLIPETEMYVRSMSLSQTKDLRYSADARQKILNSIKGKTLVLIDGASLNGKSTFAKRLAKHINASIVDIDFLCEAWINEQQSKIMNPIEHFSFLMNADKLTDEYILENLEKIIEAKSKKGNVILVGSYMEVIYRTIIARVFNRYFQQVVSLYCCAKSFKEVKAMKEARNKEFGYSAVPIEIIQNDYLYSKRLLEMDGIMLGVGMAASFITDNTVSDMFA